MHGAALDRRRDQVCPQQRRVGLAVVNRDHVAVHGLLQHKSLSARLDVLFHQRVRRIHRDVADFSRLGVIGHLQAQWIVGIQHRRVLRDLDWHPLDLGELLERIDAAQAEMVGGDVEAGSDVAAAITEATAQQAAACRFHDSGVDGRVTQHHLRRLRSGHVAGYGQLAVDVDAVGRGQPDRLARHLQDVREHA